MNPQIIVLLIGIVCIIGGIFSIRKGNNLKKKCTLKITAKVTEVEVTKQTHKEGGNEYRPIVGFTYEGKDYSGKIGIMTKSKKAYKEGDNIDVLVDPSDPACFIDAKRNVGLKSGIMFIIIGIIFLALIPFVNA